MRRQEPRFPNKLLVIGTATVVVGGVLLLWTLGRMRRVPFGLWPLLLLAAGLALLYFAWVRGRARRYLVPGLIATLCGVLFLLLETVLGWDSLPRVWPAFMVIAGVSLLPYGLRLKPRSRPAILTPAVFIAGLGLALLPFSLTGARGALASLVTAWWPVVLVVIGVALVISFFATRGPKKRV